MLIREFELAWRWTQPSHAILPDDVLSSMTVLSSSECERLFSRGLEYENHKFLDSLSCEGMEASAVREWLNIKISNIDNLSKIVWSKDTGISIPWKYFVTYWDDFLYRSSDDAFIFLDCSESILVWNHWELIKLYVRGKNRQI